MKDQRSIGELKVLGADTPATEDVVRLYDQAFLEFGALALWSSRRSAAPMFADVLSITQSLRVEGNRSARLIAERIEDLCRASL